MLQWPGRLSAYAIGEGSDSGRIHTVTQRLGQLLHSGVLTLFVGSGVSKAVNLPIWRELNVRIVENAPAILQECFPDLWGSIQSKIPSSEELTRCSDASNILDRIEGSCCVCESSGDSCSRNPDTYVGIARSWQRIVKTALYGKDAVDYAFQDLFDPELVSLCNLFMGGNRGFIRDTVTFNYDDLIETCLRLHGHAAHVVTPLPNQLIPNYGATFYHPHGYLPLTDEHPKEPSFLVLSGKSYKQVSEEGGDHMLLWRELIAWLLCTKIGLFIGISGNDGILDLYFKKALDLIGSSPIRRPLAFAVLVGDGYLSPEKWLEKYIVPLEFTNATAVAEFITDICQAAASSK